MYDAKIRATYTELFKVAERQLSVVLRPKLIKLSRTDTVLQTALKDQK
jgi:hypothetical protein